MSLLLWFLICVLFILVLLALLRLKFYQHQLDVEAYTKMQLLNKISILKQERYQSKEKRAITTTYHLNLRNTRQLLNHLLEDFKSDEKIKDFRIITTSQIAPKNPLFPFISEFDFIVITNVGMILMNIKSLKSKTFYHFDSRIPTTDEQDLNRIVGHYIAHQYHNQFQSDLKTSYTFNEIISENKITYEFHEYDPYQIADRATQNIQEAVESFVQVPVSTIGVIYCVDQRGERIDGDAQPYSRIYTSESETDIQYAIQALIDTSHTQLESHTMQQLVSSFENHHESSKHQ
ncbi:hypothetical protein RNT89_01120 [Staphylococcus pseudintermedius]|uniref:hypothetical protein n=1 Tax=Staphylococcus pseudintermedius TaxID=283734 RepID=UPI0028865ACE|nr:hypothetical protein [Staphylococcus pseudintermedius]MDT0975655.1 hypothetical protein [Staphylococcus pseudintermedius]MDT0979462.1 hypothetical protein [Staphylococcus pseudintermedius]HAR6072694.1 hypothetical protein [Staphylococcus pseudintermedius]HAR6156036.1 hypothetical protein [Staphylococcus pseudintermedius]HAR6210901.1 hypothetical protein [Staphylococcus pseudintermedius]